MMCFQKRHRHNHKQGATLIATLILSGLVLSITAGLAKVVANELEFSADFLFGEKSYFAAESGIESALLDLKTNPVMHGISTIEVDPENSHLHPNLTLTIDNLSEADEGTKIILSAHGSSKLRLRKHPDEVVSLEDLELTVKRMSEDEGGDILLWGIQCTKDEGTVSIQAQTGVKDSVENIAHWTGIYDDEHGLSTSSSVGSFWSDSNLSADEKKTCFLSFQNLIPEEINIEITGTEITPQKAIVTAHANTRNRQKIIQFEYLQNRLSAFFNFGLIHTDR